MFDPTDIQARIMELKHRQGDQFWESLKICLSQHLNELQDIINDLQTTGEKLQTARVAYNVLRDLMTGELIDTTVKRMEAKIKRDEDAAIEAAIKKENGEG